MRRDANLPPSQIVPILVEKGIILPLNHRFIGFFLKRKGCFITNKLEKTLVEKEWIIYEEVKHGIRFNGY